LGVAFQILNDLADWRGDDHNKLTAGADVFSGRPTVLWALAGESLDEADRGRLAALVAPGSALGDASRLEQVRRLYEQAGVFEKAERLVEKYRARAEAVADAIEGDDLRALLYYFVDTVLDSQSDSKALSPTSSPPGALPIVALS
jgi:geranylgeranyl pyrophosphate synthase